MDGFLYFFDVHEMVAVCLPQKLLKDIMPDIPVLLLHQLGLLLLKRILLVHSIIYNESNKHEPHFFLFLLTGFI